MKKISVHPLFLLLLAALMFMGRWALLCSSVLAVAIHELCHYLAARIKGYRLIKLTLMPYGAIMYAEERIVSDDEILISAAGPMSNLFICVFVIALWWLFPALYSYTIDFFYANFAIGAFNLLPAYPLDGSKIILSMVKNRKKAMNILKIIGIAISFVFLALFVISTFFAVNYTYMIAGVLLFVGSVGEKNKERYIHICNQISYLKDFNHPLEKKYIVINHTVPIRRIIKMLKPYCIYKIEVVNEAMNTLFFIGEQQFEDIMLKNKPNTPIGKAIEYSKAD